MEVVFTFALAFFFSFIGSIPPGTLNLSVVQLGLDNKLNVAWRFSLASALIEYPYAWLAVTFERWLTSSPWIVGHLQLITAIVMTVLGIFTWLSASKPTEFSTRFNNSGFRRGIVLGILNPLAVPYWIGITAYLRSQQWIQLSTLWELHGYLLGVALGGFVLMMLLAFLARRIASRFRQSTLLKKIPGITLLLLGLYAFIEYFRL
jgi:threonine/homoserine/homoserine lactone efflux protein